MELSERKKKVLRSVVDLYIRTAEPVGSKAIAELPDMKYSSATIRNEMAELTTMGYLEQPHTSAGRVPSASGYRLYVDELMMDYRLSVDETRSINSAIEEKMQRVDKMVEKVAHLVSQATNLPAISAGIRPAGATVKRFDLILAGQGSIILVLMLSDEQVVNKLIKLPLNVTETDLKLLSAVLNTAMTELDPASFTPELLERIAAKGVGVGYVTLHVGLGTFRPVKEDEIENHEMHSEFCLIPERTSRIVTETKKNGGRVIAVGTTSCRTLESFAAEDGRLPVSSGWTNIFIYPGYQFKCIDALITNFHLPESTLIMLVSALAGREHVLNAYKTAVEERYRFFSFGDAMLIE